MTKRTLWLLILSLLVITFVAGVPMMAHAGASPLSDFDPSKYGRVLTDDELDAVDGDAGLLGAAVSAGAYALATWDQEKDAMWYAGLGASAVLGAINPVAGSSLAASPGVLAGAARTGMQAYNLAARAVTGWAVGKAKNAVKQQ